MPRKKIPERVKQDVGSREELRDAARLREEEIAKKREEKEKRIRRAIAYISRTEAGRDFVRYLMERCGFMQPSINADPRTGQILLDNTIYNEARRNIYLELRKLIPPKELVKIEFNLEANPDDD